MNLFTFGIWFAFLGVASCDYMCICNYNVEKGVLSAASTQSNVLGYMYEFDCKPQAGVANDDKWFKVAYEHKLGYVEKDSQLQLQTCPGAVPDEDKLPPTTTATATNSTEEQTTFSALTTTPFPTTMAVVSSTPKTTMTTTTTQTSTVPTTPVVTTRETTTTTRPTTTSYTTSASTPAPTTSTVPTTIFTTTTPRHTTTTKTTTETTTESTIRTSTPTTSTSTTTRPTTSTTTQPSTTPTTRTIPTTRTMPTTSTTRTTTTTMKMTTPKPNVLQGHIELCPNRIQHLAKQPGELIAQLGHNCYEVVQTGVSWLHAETNCKHNGGHLIHIANQQEQDFIYNFLVKHHSHTVWLGLHDRNEEETFEWISGNAVTYTNWKPGRKDYRYHNSEDCVFMTPSSGQWDDIQCGGNNGLSELIQGIRHAYICQYATVDVSGPTATVDASGSDGNINMCPYGLHQQAQRDRGVLGQYDHGCYEIVPSSKVPWQNAEDICHARGGHLAYINSLQEQIFIQGFLTRYSPNHAVWIGLTDHNSEGHFHWSSGAHVTFTNWLPGHLSNYVSSSQEDCVTFIPYKSGQWDDIPCGRTHHSFFGGTSFSGEIHPLLCQYRISSGPSIIG